MLSLARVVGDKALVSFAHFKQMSFRTASAVRNLLFFWNQQIPRCRASATPRNDIVRVFAQPAALVIPNRFSGEESAFRVPDYFVENLRESRTCGLPQLHINVSRTDCLLQAYWVMLTTLT